MRRLVRRCAKGSIASPHWPPDAGSDDGAFSGTGVIGRGGITRRTDLPPQAERETADQATLRPMTASGSARTARRRSTRFSTSTLQPTGEIVPWLAASGPLSYTPETPPDRDYFFQYGWVLPDIFASEVNTLQHYYFGAWRKDGARDLFAFWHAAREGKVDRMAYYHGVVTPESVTAPIAVYLAPSRLAEARYLLMQHGSYQLVRVADQPLLESGDVLLYRGVQEAELFRWLRVEPDMHADERRQAWRAYVKAQAHVLSDSIRSFNSIHDRAKRCETSHLRDGTWMTDDVAREHGLDLDRDNFARELWGLGHQSFSLERWVADRKFGPNYVVLKTSLENIRLTTFVAGEHEVRIIDPDRVGLVEVHGCRYETATLGAELAPPDRALERSTPRGAVESGRVKSPSR